MRIYEEKNYKDVSKRAADIIVAQITLNPKSVLGLATGSTPVGMYQQLIKKYEKGNLDFSKVTTVNLDEYKGLAPKNEQSYRYFMNQNLFDFVNIDKDHTFVPDGIEKNSEKACKEYNKVLEKVGSPDIQVLGIGANGHIGFNEPGDAFIKDTHCVDLSKSTIEANSRFFEKKEEVPKQAYTMGIKNIMSAKRILLLATGEAKADALYKALCGSITPQVPASILQLHPDVIVVADKEALQKVKEK